MSNHRSLILIPYTSISFESILSQLLIPSQWNICASPSSHVQIISTSLSHYVFHQSHTPKIMNTFMIYSIAIMQKVGLNFRYNLLFWNITSFIKSHLIYWFCYNISSKLNEYFFWNSSERFYQLNINVNIIRFFLL